MTIETELEPAYVFNDRVETMLKNAADAATAAAAAEAAASDEVTRLRGDFKIGLIPRGEWDAAAKRLSKLQNARADADAAVKATERQVQRERDARQASENLIAGRERQVLAAQAAASKVRADQLWSEIFADLEEIDTLPGIPSLRSAGRAYDIAIGSMTQLRRLFSGK